MRPLLFHELPSITHKYTEPLTLSPVIAHLTDAIELCVFHQVWFQNARAKWRRLVQKTEGGAGANNGSVSGGNGGHNMSSSSSSSGSNCSGSGNETGSPVPSSSASPSHARQLNGHHQQPAASMMMMTSFMEHQQHQQHPKMHQQQQQHHMMTTSSRMSLYDEISLSGSSSVASVGFPSPL